MVSNLPFILLVLVVFVIFLMDLTLMKSFLGCCPSVSSRILLLYGENFLKQQHYNHALSSAKAASQMSKHLAIGIASGILGGTVTNVYGEYVYSVNYEKYLESIIKNPDLKIESPKKGLFHLKFGR